MYEELVSLVYELGVDVPMTFVVDGAGRLRLDFREAEHVAVADGLAVAAAGEITFSVVDGGITVVDVSNQSRGYCPEPSSWASLAAVLDQLQVGRPEAYTSAFTFRRCERCRAVNIVKDDWFVCIECDAALSPEWNFQRDAGTLLGAELVPYLVGPGARSRVSCRYLSDNVLVRGHLGANPPLSRPRHGAGPVPRA